MQVSTLSVQLERLRNISSRNELSAVLSELVKQMSPKEAKEMIYMLQCRIAPKFVPIEFNLADKQLIKFFSEFLKVPQFDEEYLKYGDMGDTVYYLLKNTSKESNYTISELYSDILALANTTGKDSVKIKASLLKGIFDKSDRLSSKYIARILSGNLRLGFSDKTILDALSIYLSGDKSKTDEVERAYGAMSDLGILTEHILSKKKLVLSDIHITPGIPVASKLVEREKDAESIWERMPNCMVQAKYDGLRCQIHVIEEGKDIENFKIENTQSSLLESSPKRVKLFSRNQEETTDMFPDLVLEAEKLKVKSVVLDSEVIGINPKTGKFIPFQETMQRKRKYNISEFASEIPIKCMIFDIMELNGKDLSGLKLEERISILEKLFKTVKSDILTVSENTVIKSSSELTKLFNRYVAEGLEGVITKALGTTYDPGTRNFDWIKLKRSSDSKLNDTVDAVVMGYYKGKGSRNEFGVGTILVGSYNKENDKYLTLAKVGTGFSQDQLKKVYEDLKGTELTEKPSNYEISGNLKVDVWVKPSIVVEIEADEITESDLHTVGYSLRFPRIKLWGRDKDFKDTTTKKEIKRMFELRKK